jgi:hypothetical protein
MKIKITLQLIDEEVTGFELGDISLIDDGRTISSAKKHPSQSMMIFIFLSELLSVLIEMQADRPRGQRVAIAPDSSFFLSLEKKGSDLIVGNGDVTMTLLFCGFTNLLYSEILSLMMTWQPGIKAEDSALRDLRKSIEKFKLAFKC